MICTTLNDFYYIERFVLHWMIYSALNDLYCVEWFVQRWTISTMLKDLYNVEWFVQRWKICTTLDDWYCVEWFCTAMDDFFNIESSGLQWIIEYSLFNECRVRLFGKILYNIYTNFWVDFLLIWKYQEEIYSTLAQKLVIKRCFWSLYSGNYS